MGRSTTNLNFKMCDRSFIKHLGKNVENAFAKVQNNIYATALQELETFRFMDS